MYQVILKILHSSSFLTIALLQIAINYKNFKVMKGINAQTSSLELKL